MTTITPLTVEQSSIAARFMASGQMGKFAKHMAAAFIAATPHHKDKMLASWHELFALGYDTQRITEGPTPIESAADTEDPTPCESAADTEGPTPIESAADTEGPGNA